MGAEECSGGAEVLEHILSLVEAAALCGLSAHTLAQQAEGGGGCGRARSGACG